MPLPEPTERPIQYHGLTEVTLMSHHSACGLGYLGQGHGGIHPLAYPWLLGSQSGQLVPKVGVGHLGYELDAGSGIIKGLPFAH
ncbi:hypothetical protein LCGC14_2807660 [marine sediment metagenome]|uniref:Uncharacterized protein n=1 Tax=marine sediment metagenome TaxID=412755 RepID=A0A0F8YKT9_9ZZZZ